MVEVWARNCENGVRKRNFRGKGETDQQNMQKGCLHGSKWPKGTAAHNAGHGRWALLFRDPWLQCWPFECNVVSIQDFLFFENFLPLSPLYFPSCTSTPSLLAAARANCSPPPLSRQAWLQSQPDLPTKEVHVLEVNPTNEDENYWIFAGICGA